MKKLPNKNRRWLGTAFVHLAAFLAVTSYVHGEQHNPIPSDAEIANSFAKIALSVSPDELSVIHDTGSAIRKDFVTKWSGEIRYGIVGFRRIRDRKYIADIRSHFTLMAELTRVPVSEVKDRKIENFLIYRLREVDYNNFIRAASNEPRRRFIKNWSENSASPCIYEAFLNSDSSIIASRALLKADMPKSLVHPCIVEEITQAFGLFADDDTVNPTVFSASHYEDLTGLDKLLVRILYDSRIKPGMRYPFARPLVEQIVKELRQIDATP